MEALAVVDLGPRLVPVAIRHARLGLPWTVLAVLEDWTTPRYHDAVGTPAETKRFQVRVSGPLPGRPSQTGEFVMMVRRYGDRPGWWISPEEADPGPDPRHCPRPRADSRDDDVAEGLHPHPLRCGACTRRAMVALALHEPA